MEHEQPTPNYNPQVPPGSPYKRAQQEWDERIGTSRVQAKNWRLAAFACILLALLSVIVVILLMISLKPTIIPYVIEVDKAGEVRRVGQILEQDYVPEKAAIEHFLWKFVTNIRTVPLDPVILSKQIKEAYAFTAGKATNRLSGYFQETKPAERVRKSESVSVEVDYIIEERERSDYRIRWKETTFGRNGVKLGVENWVGTFLIEFKQPQNEDQLRKNPLGIYIVSFDATRTLQ